MLYKTAGRHQAKPSPKRQWKRGAIFVMFAVSMGIFELIQLDRVVRPFVQEVLVYHCKNRAMRMVQEVFDGLVDQQGYLFEGLYQTNQTQDGQIQSIHVDGLVVNHLEDALVQRVNEILEDDFQMTFSIPVGTLTGIQMFNDKGPSLTVKAVPISYAKSNMDTQFVSAGINQTRWELTICVQVELGLVYAGQVYPVQVETDLMAGQIWVVGQVPQVSVGQGVAQSQS